MPVTVLAGALQGVDAIPIEVEVDLLNRLPSVCIVGLAAHAVKESAERIRSAIGSCANFPRGRVVVNLMPADVRKEGTALDLPMALGILAAAGEVPAEAVGRVLAAGELSLSGELRPVRGALSFAMLAREMGRALLLPRACARVAALVPGAEVVAADTLEDVVAWLRGELLLPAVAHDPQRRPPDPVDLADVRGQHVARLGLELAAAGAHHLWLSGPPGCGKSMLAKRLPTILPEMTFEEALACTRIHSAAGLLERDPGLLSARPFRAPHHSVSVAGMIGDRSLRPGEVALAHNGVLFLDEAPEFPRSVLELLRQPLQDGIIRLTRAQGTITYPAAITLVLASNPCPCGQYGDDRRCTCTATDVIRYRRRLSGPILDRVDLHVSLSPVSPVELLAQPPGEDSATVRARVVAARQRQLSRGQPVPNGQLESKALEEYAPMTPSARDVLHKGCESLQLTGRGAGKVIRVARTLADLDAVDIIDEQHILDALSFRTPREEVM